MTMIASVNITDSNINSNRLILNH